MSPRRPGIQLLLAVATAVSLVPVAGRAAQSVTSIVSTFGNATVQEGLATGLEVAIVIGRSPPHFFNFGVTDATTGAAPTPDTVYYLASLTKVFTTNLLAQGVVNGTYSLSQPLSDFAAMTGPLSPLSGSVTLLQLGDFTSGFPRHAPLCAGGATPPLTGCIPNYDPSTTQYDANDFLTFFHTYQLPGPPPNAFEYSSFGIGLIGLILGGTPGQLITNDALTGWANLVQTRITAPLGLASTYYQIPPAALPRLAPGYDLAQGSIVVKSDGSISRINISDGGGKYTTPPAVTITGGGGTGATAETTIDSTLGSVNSVTVTRGGTGYLAAPVPSFTGGGATLPAHGRVIVQNGVVTGVMLTSAGSGYSSPPTVTITGGRNGGHDATGVAHIANGQVSYVTITDGGAGYVPALAVVFAPGSASSGSDPIWSPANALASTAKDMATIAAAGLGHTTIGSLHVPPIITQAFNLAETPFACQGPDPDLGSCNTFETGLSWRIAPYDAPTTSKDGAGGGYSTYLVMMPSTDTAVVVLANSYSSLAVAQVVGDEIIHGLYYGGLLPARR